MFPEPGRIDSRRSAPVSFSSLAQRGKRLAAGAIALLILAGCASDGPTPQPELTRTWHEFLALPEQRALAIAGEPRRGPWVTASSGGHATRDEAVAEALLRCQVRRESRRMQAECVLYGVGSEIVWRGR